MGFLPTTKYKNNERTVSGSVNVENSDLLLNVDTSLVACTINLQSIPNDNWNTLYKLYVKDISGNAGTNNITIVAPTGYKINNSQTLILNTNNESVLIRISSNLDYVVITQGIKQAYTTVQDEGSNLPQRNIIDFVGTGVTASDNGTKTIVTINSCCDFTILTNSQFLDLIGTNTVEAGHFYKITNPINADEGVVVQGIVTNANPSLQGSGIFLNADYQNVGDYSGVSGYAGNLGIWSSVVQTVVAGNVVIWGNRHWKNLAGNWGSALNSTTLDDNWILLPKNTTNGYIREVDFIKYNVYTNLVIYRADRRLNEVDYYVSSSDSISNFQWGRDLVLGNKVYKSVMFCTNSYCQYLNNYIYGGSFTDTTDSTNGTNGVYESNFITYGSFTATNNYGNVFNNIINNGSSIQFVTNNSSLIANSLSSSSVINVTIINEQINQNTLNYSSILVNDNQNIINQNTLNSRARINISGINYASILRNTIGALGTITATTNTSSANINNCLINYEIFPEYFTINQNGKIINTGYSNFYTQLALDDITIYDLGTQTLTIPHEQFGLIELVNTNSYTISKINNISKLRNTRFTIYNDTLVDTYVTFQHTVIASANSGDLVCDAPSSANTLVGRYFGSDFIEYQMNGDNTTSNYVNLRTNLVKLA